MDRSTNLPFDLALPVDDPARIDLYGCVHKGLRAFMFDTLERLGRCDALDAAELAEATAGARTLLATMRSHLEHENAFVHETMEARRPGSSRTTAEDHDEHRASIAALGAGLDALEALPEGARPWALYRLYLRFARFVAENLEHMEVEETHNTAMLRDAYDDAELAAMHDRLIASIPPAEMAVFHRWMFVAMSHGERLGMLSAMRAHAPAPVFDASVERCRELLAPRDWARLAGALGVSAGAAVDAAVDAAAVSVR